MIIEIKDLPHGRKVKQIRVDVTFEEDGVKVSEQYVPGDSRDPVKSEIEKDQDIKQSTQDFETREAKDVPEEMLNMEF